MSNLSTAVEQRSQAPAQVSQEDTVLGMIRQQEKAIARALPRGMSEERFARILVTTVKQTPGLLRCDPVSFLGAAMTAAQLGLEPGPLGEAYLVPYGRDCSFIPGAPGLVKLAVQSGHVKSVIARTVYQGDEFEYEYGLDEKLVHRPSEGDQGPATHHYAVAKFTNGGHEFIVMSQSAVDAHRKKFAKSQKAWNEHPDAMARKTVVKQLCKLLPKSAEMAQALSADERSFRLTDAEVVAVAEEPVQVTYGDAIDTGEAQAIEQGDQLAVEADAEPGTLPVDPPTSGRARPGSAAQR